MSSPPTYPILSTGPTTFAPDVTETMNDSNTPAPRQCTICRTGQLERGTTTITLERGDTTLVIKAVPALVCDTCGEGYTDGPTTDRVLEIGEQAAAQGVQVDVRRFVPEDEDMERAA